MTFEFLYLDGKRINDDELNYLFFKVQAVQDNPILEAKYLNQLIKAIKSKNIPISKTNVVEYLKSRYKHLKKVADTIKLEDLNHLFLRTIKIKIVNEDDLKDKKQEQEQGLFSDSYFLRRRR